jgi:hypothetical protein
MQCDAMRCKAVTNGFTTSSTWGQYGVVCRRDETQALGQGDRAIPPDVLPRSAAFCRYGNVQRRKAIRDTVPRYSTVMFGELAATDHSARPRGEMKREGSRLGPDGSDGSDPDQTLMRTYCTVLIQSEPARCGRFERRTLLHHVLSASRRWLVVVWPCISS